MKVEEILDYKLKKLLGTTDYALVTADDKKFILAQAKVKIQAYCHRKDMPKAINYIWADIAIEILKNIDVDLFKIDVMSEDELSKRVTSIKAGDTTISVGEAVNDEIDTGYRNNSSDDAILNSFAKQLRAFRKFPAGNGDGLDGV